jgi:hypothetical protein
MGMRSPGEWADYWDNDGGGRGGRRGPLRAVRTDVRQHAQPAHPSLPRGSPPYLISKGKTEA